MSDSIIVLSRTAEHGDNAPEAADLYFSYGKALLENAITQSSVLGKDQGDGGLADEKGKCHRHPHVGFSF